LIEKFDLKKVSKKSAIFDHLKLDWLNGKYIRQLDESRYIALSVSFLNQAGLVDEAEIQHPSASVVQMLLSVKDKLKKFSELPGLVEFFFVDSVILTDEARQQVFTGKDNLSLLQELHDRLSGLEAFDEASLEGLVQGLIAEKGLKLGSFAQPVRAAITGRTSSPGIFLTMAILGKDRVLKRLDDVLRRFQGQTPTGC
jgi:glutamyl/glutaminyl-tRNA synthetase